MLTMDEVESDRVGNKSYPWRKRVPQPNNVWKKEDSNCRDDRGPPGTSNRYGWFNDAKRIERENLFGDRIKEMSICSGARL